MEEEKKMYYSIGEVADKYGVNTSLIRFWEKEFSILKPHKNKKGNRLFTQKDLDNIDKIYELVKVKGLTLTGAKKALRNKEVLNEFTESKTSAAHAPLPFDQAIKRMKNLKTQLEKALELLSN